MDIIRAIAVVKKIARARSRLNIAASPDIEGITLRNAAGLGLEASAVGLGETEVVARDVIDAGL
jgi:hypothetical protein